MTHDFAKQRAARNARNSSDPGVPWRWLLSGIVIGAAFTLLIDLALLQPPAGGFHGKRSSDSAATRETRQKAQARRTTDRGAGAAPASTRTPPQFDFYDILRDNETSPGTVGSATQANPAAPAPVTVPEPASTAAPAREAGSGTTATAPARDISETAKTTSEPRLILQAGAFSRAADADRRRGELLLLGYDARVETVHLPDGQTRFRVQVGPFATPQARAQAQRALHDVGIETL